MPKNDTAERDRALQLLVDSWILDLSKTYDFLKIDRYHKSDLRNRKGERDAAIDALSEIREKLRA